MNLKKTYNKSFDLIKAQQFSEIVQDITLIIARLWIAIIFFKSGILKISNWNGTLYLFQDIYRVPLLHPEFAAYLTSAMEITFPIFIAFGVFARLTVLPLFLMTLTIQYILPNEDLKSMSHCYWLFIMLVTISFGSGRASLDYFIAKKTSIKQIK